MRRVVVTGLGAITPLGVGVQRSWTRLLRGDIGIVSTSTLADPLFETLPSQVAALVPRGTEEGCWNPAKLLDVGDERKMAVFSQFAVAAAQEACQDANWDGKKATELERERAGVCLGSGIGSFQDVYNMSITFDKSGYKKVSPLFVPRLLINLAAGHITMKHGLLGPNHAVSTACTTGLHSLGDASRFIKYGDADIMIAGGSESCIHPLALAGFCRAKSLSTSFNDQPEKSSRPFDRDRSGFVIGEGAGVMVLEELEHAKRRGVKKIYAELTGYGLSADAHHMTAPPSDGFGAYRAMRNSLRDARLKPIDVNYINAHATSTILGDIAESNAIRQLMSGPAGKSSPSEVNVSSIKGAIGHLLGAAGAVESIMTVLSIYNNILPPTMNLEKPDDAGPEFAFNHVPLRAQEMQVDVAISNSFGFGGTNASLCFAKFREQSK